MSAVLQVRDLAVHFGRKGGVKAVDGVDLEIQAGETLGLVGESGCGKSTLSNAIVGLVPATRGSVSVCGQEIVGADARSLRAARRNVQMIFQDPALSLDPRASIGSAIGEPLAARGLLRGAKLRERVAELLGQVGLDPAFAGRYPHQFSGGQRQRVVIARALALEPALVVCDEPVSALDISVRAQILNLLVALQIRTGVAYLFVSHDLTVVRHVSDAVAVMYLGRIVERAPRDVFFASPRHPYTLALMAAAPEADPAAQRAKTRLVLEGELPSPAAVPAGCAFHTRCPRATALCAAERPALSPRPDGALVACHHA
jgi:peptide/nickel transport system ATP-binding protein/oligopeptide transport system ATP-binding protein